DNPLRKIFFFTSLAFYQPEIPDTLFLLLAEALAGFRERKRDWTCGGTATCGKIGEGAIL
ncbi:hypothetical protein, partial [Pseudomonas aeruginosa]|uniref:hypothetical protein n=1 Tax=Pseudomonas aeruginosa TaxID=287 RepID=UPI00376FBFCC